MKRKRCNDDGLVTVEWALMVLVGAAVAGVLLVFVKGDAIKAKLEGLILQALG